MRRFALACWFLALGIAPLAGQEPSRRTGPTLTAAEVEDGWISLFDGETTFGWTGKEWKVVNSELVSPGKDAPLRSTCEFSSFRLEFECIREGEADVTLTFGGDAASGYGLYGNHPGWQKVGLTVNDIHGAGIIESIDPKKGSPVFPENTIRKRRGQPVPLVFTGESLRLRNIKLKPIQMKTLFNGNDLTGWHVFPGKKSTFTVVDGTINVKDGPGDLQSEGKFGDFLLQLECISNGKHLNSGVFFRCRPNEYQNGYEAQVRNEFTAKPTQKYLVEEYDPKTHKLLGKKEVFSTAVDFGTGAIYRRQPARKQMSRDGEWFTMTVVAHGNHFPTWVNGVQVVDWTDNRPPSDNARTGYRREAGHISFQGHDPTTDLSFRNIRVQEYPGK
jgi:hypothetical protein